MSRQPSANPLRNVTIALGEDLRRAVEHIAEVEDRSIPYLIRRAIRQYLASLPAMDPSTSPKASSVNEERHADASPSGTLTGRP